MMSLRTVVLIIVSCCSLAGTAGADIVFPARLSISEKEIGVYEVTFTLPIVEGRKLRAIPVMPPTCSDVTPREVVVTSSGHTTTWTVKCEPSSLAGDVILVDGLLGTQTDLAFDLQTTEGRSFNGILRPSRPGFIVPPPPSLFDLAVLGSIEGMRRVMRDVPLWLLLVVAALSGLRRREMLAAAMAFAFAHAAAQWLGSGTWLQVPIAARDTLTLLPAILPAAALAGADVRWSSWLRPFWPLMFLLGALLGGARPEALPPDGLSGPEQLLAISFFGIGVGLGLILISAIGVELETLLRLVRSATWRKRLKRTLGYLGGAIVCGTLIAQTATTLLLPTGAVPASVDLNLFAVLSGLTLVATGRGGRWTLPVFAILVTAGGAIAILRIPLPLGSAFVLGSLLLLGVSIAWARPLPWLWLALAALVAIPAHGWHTATHVVETTSRSTGVVGGIGLVAIGVVYAGLAVGRSFQNGVTGIGIRVFGACVALFAVWARLGEYRTWFDREVATEAALGLLRVPVLAIVLLAIAAALWPRRRRVVVELGMEAKRRPVHWIVLAVAFLLLPHGTLTARNPFYEPHAPRGEDARRVVTRVLSDTYHAFNIGDESELYDRLAESVTVDLIDDLYLDSRRRLTAGTRQGAEVTVREVSVLDIGDPHETAAAEAEFTYDCRWVVVARVRHLQHVHHRRNIYNGVLTLRADDGRWKIAELELLSEDRVVVPANP